MWTIAAVVVAAAGCSQPTAAPTSQSRFESLDQRLPAAALVSTTAAPADAGVAPGAQPRLAADPVQLGDDLVADETVLRDPTRSEAELMAAARHQQAAYRSIGRHPEWDTIIGPRIPASLAETFGRNLDARRQLDELVHIRDDLPAWHIEEPAPADQLLGYYREAEASTGVGWTYLAAINLIETRFGSISGVSTAGADGPMQFLPATFAAYGGGGDIRSPRDSIMAAGRYLAANGFAADPDHAIYRYNHSDHYVAAVKQYAAALAADPGAFAGYYRWDVYCTTVAGDVLLPIGYAADEPIPVGEYLATHPQ